jgi:creatinine amidohydrolase
MMSNKNNTLPTDGHPLRWEQLAWPDFPQALARVGYAVIWPLGATEQHGPHLGTGVDTLIAKAVCDAVSARTGVPVLPPLPTGCSSGHSRKWPGTISLTPQTLIAVVAETAEWLASSGVQRLFLISSHVTNFAPLRCALEMIRARNPALMVALIQTSEISQRVRDAFRADAGDWHANAAETSLMLALCPDIVVKDRIALSDDPDRTAHAQFVHCVDATSKNGVTGYPSRASADSGRQLFSMMVEDLTERVLSGLQEVAPLAREEAETHL